MVFFLYGPDTFQSRHKLLELKEKYLREVEHGEYNILKIDGEQVEGSKLQEIFSVPPFLAKRRMIIVENLLKKGNKKLTSFVLQFLKKDSSDIFVFWEGDCRKLGDPLFAYLKKGKYVQEFKSLNPRQLQEWIKERLAERGLSISPAAIGLLKELIGSDLWQMQQEIEKISAYLQANKKLAATESVIRLLVQGKTEASIFPLLDSLSQKNIAEFMKLLEEQILGGKSEIYLIASLVGLFRNLIQIKDGFEQNKTITSNELASRLNLHPFVVLKARKILSIFSLEELKKIYRIFLEADVRLKSLRVLKSRLFIDLVAAEFFHEA